MSTTTADEYDFEESAAECTKPAAATAAPESGIQKTCIRLLGGAAAAVMLIPSSVYNIAPNWHAAFAGGDEAGPAAALMAVQAAAVILIAISPKNRRRWLVVALMLFSGWAAYKTGHHGHAAETSGNKDKITRAVALNDELAKLRQHRDWFPKSFTKVGQDEVDVAIKAQTAADKASANCWKTCTEDRATARAATTEAKRLTAQRTLTIDYEKTANEIAVKEAELLRLGYVPHHADVLDGQVAGALGGIISEDAAASLQIAFVALFVELINRFGPMTAYELVMRAFGQKTHEEEEEERRLEALEREAQRRIREHELVAAEAKARTEAERNVREVRAQLAREEADRKAQAELEEKRRQAALLATPATTHKEAKERAKLEEDQGAAR